MQYIIEKKKLIKDPKLRAQQFMNELQNKIDGVKF